MAVEVFADGGMVITGEHINTYRLLVLRRGLMAEKLGMRLSRGASCLSIVKREFGIKARTAADALPLFEDHLRSIGVLFK